MAKQIMLAGTTSRREYIFILDSSSTVGAGRTGLTSATAGWKVYYVRPGAAPLPITLTAAVGPTIAFTSASLSEVDATNMPGVYRFDVPDVVFAAGQDKAIVMLSGPTNVAPVTLEYQLTAAGEPWIAGGIWNAQLANHATAGSGETFGTDTYGTKVSRTTTPNRNMAVAGTQRVEANVASTGTAVISSASFAAGAIDATVIATGAITNAELANSAVEEIADGVLSRKLNMAGNISDVSVTSVSSATFTGANTYIATDTVQFLTTAPTSFALATKYYVIATSLTATTFQLSATSGGSAITTVSTGAFTVLPIDDRTVRSALRYVRNKVAISGSTMTVSIEDDATSAWTAALTTSPGVDPVTTLDPA